MIIIIYIVIIYIVIIFGIILFYFIFIIIIIIIIINIIIITVTNIKTTFTTITNLITITITTINPCYFIINTKTGRDPKSFLEPSTSNPNLCFSVIVHAHGYQKLFSSISLLPLLFFSGLKECRRTALLYYYVGFYFSLSHLLGESP